MNPGYLSYILICITVILLVSGWKDALLRGVSARAITLFFIGWFALSEVKFSLGQWTISGPYAGLVILFFFLLSALPEEISVFYLMACGLTLGLFYFLANGISLSLAGLPGSSQLWLGLLIGLLVISLYRNPIAQLACITLCILSGSLLQMYSHASLAGYRLGFGHMKDHWWLFAFSARIITAALGYIALMTRTWFQQWTEARKEKE